MLEEQVTKIDDILIYQNDALSWLSTLEDNSIDLIITDPPYESLEKHRAVGTTTRLKTKWFEVFPNSDFDVLFFNLYRVLKNNSHLYMFCDAETMFLIKPIGEKYGFKFWKPLVWDKKQIGMGYHYRARYEFILFFEKGKRRLNNLGIADILEAPRINGGYPTQKPVSINKILIEQSSSIGDLVIDPFMGSGTVGVAARQLNRRFWGSDISKEAIEFANIRFITGE